jgi:hypothetical protein
MAMVKSNSTNTRLLRNLAEKLDLPLRDLVANGDLPNQIAAQMEDNCKACPIPPKCTTYLNSTPEKIEKPPSFCLNGRLLGFLAKNLTKKP